MQIVMIVCLYLQTCFPLYIHKTSSFIHHETNDVHVKEDVFMHMGLTLCIKSGIF